MIYDVVAKYDYTHTKKNIFTKIGLRMIKSLDMSYVDKMTLDVSSG